MEINLMIDTHQADHNTRQLDNQLPTGRLEDSAD